MSTVITFPTPPYSNPPIEPQFFQPSQFFISNVTLGQTTTVTTVKNMNFAIGQLVRLIIPTSFGCRQLNGLEGYVILIPSPNQVGVAIDSSKNVDPFIASTASTQPQILSIGDINSGQVNANGRSPTLTFIPGSFQNISP